MKNKTSFTYCTIKVIYFKVLFDVSIKLGNLKKIQMHATLNNGKLRENKTKKTKSF